MFLVALMLLSQPAASTTLTSGGGTSGEEGSGPPAIPVVYPESSLDLMRSRAASVSFSDIGPEHAWAGSAIRYVAGTYTWMRDFAPGDDGTYPFRPGAIETRKHFARAVVKAFAPGEEPNPAIMFTDLDPSSTWYRWAAVAVRHGWLTADGSGAFAPDEPVTMATVHRALVWALGLKPAARSLNQVHTRGGQTFKVPANFGSLVLGLRLGLRYNAPTGSESQDVGPTDELSRAQVAYSLFRAKTQPSWNVPSLLEQYAEVELPFLGPKKHALVQWGIRYGGYPYVWGGEWGFESQEPSALGAQPRSGFDCSGLTWWILRADDAIWNIAPPRPYGGWALAQRTSADMATMTPKKITYGNLEPGDLMFYDGDDDGVVDHVDTFIGNGFALDSSSTPGGVTIMWVGDGWYRQHFVHGRRVLP